MSKKVNNHKILPVIALAAFALLLCSCVNEKYEAIEITAKAEIDAEEDTESESESESVLLVIDTTESGDGPEIKISGTLYATDTVNIRDKASTESTVIGQLQIGDSVDYIRKTDGEWTEVLIDGNTGYIADRYLTDDPAWMEHLESKNGYNDGDLISLEPNWKYADFSEINSGNSKMYLAVSDRKNIIVGINAGHGTEGGTRVKTWCHPDKTPKVTGGSTSAGSIQAAAVSSGMKFKDGTPEQEVTLREAQILRDNLLSRGYDVLMVRDGEDVQLDNVARTVICNNVADCHIAIHWDGDGLDKDKGCFYMSVPDGIKYLDNVASTWESSERLGNSLIKGLSDNECTIYGSGNMDIDLTQTSYSTVPSVDIELGNQCSDHSDEKLNRLANGLADGIDIYFN